jgi:hypothetical protein
VTVCASVLSFGASTHFTCPPTECGITPAGVMSPSIVTPFTNESRNPPGVIPSCITDRQHPGKNR